MIGLLIVTVMEREGERKRQVKGLDEITQCDEGKERENLLK